jgi:hypothetical protein
MVATLAGRRPARSEPEASEVGVGAREIASLPAL